MHAYKYVANKCLTFMQIYSYFSLGTILIDITETIMMSGNGSNPTCSFSGGSLSPLASPEHFKPYTVPRQPEQKTNDIAVSLSPNSSQKKKKKIFKRILKGVKTWRQYVHIILNTSRDAYVNSVKTTNQDPIQAQE